MALAFLSGRHSRDLVRPGCIFLSNRLPTAGPLANDGTAGMGFWSVGTRKTAEPTFDEYRSDTSFAHCASARQRSLSSILHWVQRDFLAADYSQRSVGTFRYEGRFVRRSALRSGAFRNVV